MKCDLHDCNSAFFFSPSWDRKARRARVKSFPLLGFIKLWYSFLWEQAFVKENKYPGLILKWDVSSPCRKHEAEGEGFYFYFGHLPRELVCFLDVKLTGVWRPPSQWDPLVFNFPAQPHGSSSAVRIQYWLQEHALLRQESLFSSCGAVVCPVTSILRCI